MTEKMMEMFLGMIGITKDDMHKGIGTAKAQWEEFQSRMTRIEILAAENNRMLRLLVKDAAEVASDDPRLVGVASKTQAP